MKTFGANPPHFCSKRGYPTKERAEMALHAIRLQDDPSRPKQEQRAYYCTEHACWHLTSWEVPDRRFTQVLAS